MILLEKQLKILDYLKANDEWVTGQELAKVVGVSDRTIRNYINEIKKEYGEESIESVRTKGYRINSKVINKGKNTDYNIEIINPVDRMLYLVKKLIVSNKKINIFEIAEKLYISEKTLEADISRIKKELKELSLIHVSIVKSGEYIRISGKYNHTNNILYDIAKANIPDLQFSDLQKFFLNVNLDFLHFTLDEILKKYKYKTRYLSITKFILDVAIIIEAKYIYEYSYGKKMSKCIDSSLSKKYKTLADEISLSIKNNLQIDISQEDTKYLHYILSINGEMEELEEHIRNSDVEDNGFYESCLAILERSSIDNGIDFLLRDDIIEDLIIHLRVAIERVRLGISIFNPLCGHLKVEYPYLVAPSIEICDKISSKYGIVLDENEVSYVTAYLATAMQELINNIGNENALDILLIVPEGKSLLNFIARKIENLVDQKSVNIEGITDIYKLKDSENMVKNYDIIITTSSRLYIRGIEVITIKKSFTILDKISVKNSIDKIVSSKRVFRFQKALNEFMSSELFFKDFDVKDKEDAIEKICKILQEKGYVNEGYRDLVIKREEYGTTATDFGVALPHAARNDALKNGMAIVIFKQPINWDGYKVKVMFMFTHIKGKSKNRELLINFIVDGLLYHNMGEEIRKSRSFEQCMGIFSNHYLKEFVKN